MFIISNIFSLYIANCHSLFCHSFIVFADQFAKYRDATVLAGNLSTTIRNYIDTNDEV